MRCLLLAIHRDEINKSVSLLIKTKQQRILSDILTIAGDTGTQQYSIIMLYKQSQEDERYQNIAAF